MSHTYMTTDGRALEAGKHAVIFYYKGVPTVCLPAWMWKGRMPTLREVIALVNA